MSLTYSLKTKELFISNQMIINILSQNNYSSNVEKKDTIYLPSFGIEIKIKEIDNPFPVEIEELEKEFSPAQNIVFNLNDKSADMEKMKDILFQLIMKMIAASDSDVLLTYNGVLIFYREKNKYWLNSIPNYWSSLILLFKDKNYAVVSKSV